MVTFLRFRRVRNSQTRLRADVCKLICCENHRCTQRRRIGPRKSPSRLESHGPRSNQEPRSSLIQLRLPGQIRGTCGLEDGGALRSPGASIHLGIIRLKIQANRWVIGRSMEEDGPRYSSASGLQFRCLPGGPVSQAAFSSLCRLRALLRIDCHSAVPGLRS